jgi:hypothetical protein
MSFFESVKSEVKRILTFLLIIFFPYMGFFIIAVFKPFSVKTRKYLFVYCIIVCALAIYQIKEILVDKNETQNDSKEISNIENVNDVLSTYVTNENASPSDVNENITVESQQIVVPETTIETDPEEIIVVPNYREVIENSILKLYNEGLNFSLLNYIQWDPMEIDLYHCKSTFEGKMTKKKHNYLARVGFNRETEESVLYYLSIDGETIMWDEDGEDSFIDSK